MHAYKFVLKSHTFNLFYVNVSLHFIKCRVLISPRPLGIHSKISNSLYRALPFNRYDTFKFSYYKRKNYLEKLYILTQNIKTSRILFFSLKYTLQVKVINIGTTFWRKYSITELLDWVKKLLRHTFETVP